jgi:hypothetical protein
MEHARIVEYRFDAPTHTFGSRWLFGPERLQHPHHQRGVYGRDRQVAQDRIDHVRQTRFPLLAMLGIAPAALMRGDVLLGDFPEGLRARLRHLSLRALLFS